MEVYIDREKALKKLTQLEIDNPNFTMTGVKMALMSILIYNVVNENAHWITHGENQDVFECSECHEEVWDEKTPYCPYCGAKMEEVNVSN